MWPLLAHCGVCVCVGIPPSKRSEVWPLLAQRYRARNDPDWSMPPEITGPSGLAELLRGETEFEHNIVVDLGKERLCN